MRERGFTLVEVMVALAIVAVALPALLVALYQQVDDTGYLRDKTLAEMVAANQLAQMRLVVASTRTLTAGKDNGTVTLADREWYWWIETTTQQANFFRIQIDVALQEEQREHPLYSLTTYMSGDLREDQTGISGDGGGGEGGDGGEDGAGGGGEGGNGGSGAADGSDVGVQVPVDPSTGLPAGVAPDGQ